MIGFKNKKTEIDTINLYTKERYGYSFINSGYVENFVNNKGQEVLKRFFIVDLEEQTKDFTYTTNKRVKDYLKEKWTSITLPILIGIGVAYYEEKYLLYSSAFIATTIFYHYLKVSFSKDYKKLFLGKDTYDGYNVVKKEIDDIIYKDINKVNEYLNDKNIDLYVKEIFINHNKSLGFTIQRFENNEDKSDFIEDIQTTKKDYELVKTIFKELYINMNYDIIFNHVDNIIEISHREYKLIRNIDILGEEDEKTLQEISKNEKINIFKNKLQIALNQAEVDGYYINDVKMNEKLGDNIYDVVILEHEDKNPNIQEFKKYLKQLTNILKKTIDIVENGEFLELKIYQEKNIYRELTKDIEALNDYYFFTETKDETQTKVIFKHKEKNENSIEFRNKISLIKSKLKKDIVIVMDDAEGIALIVKDPVPMFCDVMNIYKFKKSPAKRKYPRDERFNDVKKYDFRNYIKEGYIVNGFTYGGKPHYLSIDSFQSINLVGAATGGGKGVIMRNVLQQVLYQGKGLDNQDVNNYDLLSENIYIADWKESSDYEDILGIDRVEYVGADLKGWISLLRKIKSIMKGRQKWLKHHSKVYGSNMLIDKPLIVVLDELGALMEEPYTPRDNPVEYKAREEILKLINQLAMLGRSSGVKIFIVAQKFDAETLNTKARSNAKGIYGLLQGDNTTCNQLFGNEDVLEPANLTYKDLQTSFLGSPGHFVYVNKDTGEATECQTMPIDMYSIEICNEKVKDIEHKEIGMIDDSIKSFIVEAAREEQVLEEESKQKAENGEKLYDSQDNLNNMIQEYGTEEEKAQMRNETVDGKNGLDSKDLNDMLINQRTTTDTNTNTNSILVNNNKGNDKFKKGIKEEVKLNSLDDLNKKLEEKMINSIDSNNEDKIKSKKINPFLKQFLKENSKKVKEKSSDENTIDSNNEDSKVKIVNKGLEIDEKKLEVKKIDISDKENEELDNLDDFLNDLNLDDNKKKDS